MRLAQLARKVKVKPTEIRNFIQREFDLELDADPNIKVDDKHVEAVVKEFHVEEEIIEEVKEVKEEVAEEEYIDASIDTDLESLKEVVVEDKEEKLEEGAKAEDKKEETVVEETKIEEAKTTKPKSASKGAKSITYNEDDEHVHINDAPTTTVEVEVDPNAELIAGEIETLEGLKVVGKIDLGTDKEEEVVEEVEFDENEQIVLPTMEAIDSEIEKLDGDVDTSSFTNIAKEGASDEEKDAIFAELDAAMDNKSNEGNKVKKVVNKPAAEVSENIEEEEDSIYKNSKGIYRFTSEQRENRLKSLSIKEDKERIRLQKEKKARHYKENVAANTKVKKKKKGPSKKQIAKQEAEANKKEAPTTFWGKIKNWLND
jgi:hypothetical protein